MVLWELCNKLKFDHTIKWYIYKPEFVFEHATHKNLGDFEIQTSNMIPDKRPELIIITKKMKIKKRTCCIEGFTVTADKRVKIKENEKKKKKTST